PRGAGAALGAGGRSGPAAAEVEVLDLVVHDGLDGVVHGAVVVRDEDREVLVERLVGAGHVTSPSRATPACPSSWRAPWRPASRRPCGGSSARGERSRRRSGPGSSRPGRRSPCGPGRPWLCNLLGRVKTTRSAQPGHSLPVAVCARQGEYLVLAALQRLPVPPERRQLLVTAERGGGQRPRVAHR